MSPTLLRLDVSGRSTFRDLVVRARREFFTVMSVPELQLVPFVFPRFNDYFRVIFNFLGSEPALQWPGLEVTDLPWQEYQHLFRVEGSFLDWYFQLGETSGDGLVGFARVNTALWSEATVREVLDELNELLIAGARTPDAPLR